MAAAIELSVNREKPRSLAHEENDARLMQAVAIFATPGAMAAAAVAACRPSSALLRRVVSEPTAIWSTRLGYRVGTEALFAELEKDPGPFRARYGGGAEIRSSRPEFGRERRRCRL